MSKEDSRTQFLNSEFARDLGDSMLLRDMEAFSELIEELPEGLSRTEVDDIGHNVRIWSEFSNGKNNLERDVIFHLGNISLYRTHDLVTAHNVIKSLRRKGVRGLIGSMVLRHELSEVSKQLVFEITDLEEDS